MQYRKHVRGLSIKKLWRLRYRIYAIVLIGLLSTVLHSDTASITAIVPDDSLYFNVTEDKLLTKKIEKFEKEPLPAIAQVFDRDGETVYIDENGEYANSYEEAQLINSLGYVMKRPSLDLRFEEQIANATAGAERAVFEEDNSKALNDILRAPANPERTSFIEYPKFGIKAPVLWASDRDMYQTDANGAVDYNEPIIEDPNATARGDFSSTPVLRMLLDGVVHLGGVTSPNPGELGNSYIVGHSSNYGTSVSTYESIFTPLIDAAQIGDEINVWDPQGRKLTFRVFENDEVYFAGEENVERAYATERFKDRRVITLQTCKSYWQGGRWVPTHRYLVRAELVEEG